MIDNPSREVVMALERLNSDSDFQTVIGWLGDNLDKIRVRATEELDDRLLRRSQGGAMVLQEVLKHTRTAHARAESLRRR